MRKLEAM